jgi:hypothetical protein
VDAVVVLGAAVVGLVAALGAAWLTGRHQQTTNWRSELVRSAVDFRSAFERAALAVSDALASARDDVSAGRKRLTPRTRKTLMEADDLWNELHVRHGQLEIVFGVGSDTARHAGAARLGLRLAIDALGGAEEVADLVSRAGAHYLEADPHRLAFSDAANRAIRESRL